MYLKTNSIPHLHNSFSFQCDVPGHLIAMKARSKLFFLPRTYNYVSIVSIYLTIQGKWCVNK